MKNGGHVNEGAIDLYLSVEIADEVVETLSEGRFQARYLFSQEQVGSTAPTF